MVELGCVEMASSPMSLFMPVSYFLTRQKELLVINHHYQSSPFFPPAFTALQALFLHFSSALFL